MSDPIISALNSLGAGVVALLQSSSIQTQEKEPLITGINAAMTGLEGVVATLEADGPNLLAAEIKKPSLAPIVAEAQKVGVQLVQPVENAVGEAVEGAADAEIAAVTGPFAPLAQNAANAVLEAVGGKLEDAIAAILHIGGASQATATQASTPAAAVANAVVAASPH